jgi:hypothetical protein
MHSINRVFTIPDHVELAPYKPLLLLEQHISNIISIYSELATMHFTNLLIPTLLTIPGTFATPETSDNLDALNILGLGCPASPEYTCCLYLTTEPDWQGARMRPTEPVQ